MINVPYRLPAFREYQKETYEKLWNHQGVPVVCQLPTGAGKGLIISRLLIDLISESKSILVLVPTIELLDNIYDRIVSYSSYLKPFIGKMGTGRGRDIDSPIVIAVYKSVASLLKRKGKLPYFHVVISDECHHSVASQWMELLNYYSKSWNIGFTATPARLDGKPLNLIYKVLIESKPVSWFIKNGYLCDYILKSHKTEFKVTSGFNDDLRDQQSYFDRQGIIGDSIREWEANALGKKTLFFCTGINHAVHVMNEFNDYFGGKYRFGYIGSDMTTNQRAKVLDEYKSSALTGLTNVAIVTEGVDIPDISCVSALRFTASLPLYLQMNGRALRPKKDGSKAILLDHAGNALEHGAPDFDHEWNIEPLDDSINGGYSKINCPMCELPVISYKKLASYGEKGIDISCPNCDQDHHYQHTPVERGERGLMPMIDTSKDLVDFSIDPITFKIAKILKSNRLQQKKIKAIVDLERGLAQKMKALKELGLNSSAIDTYLDLRYTEGDILGL